MKERKLTTSKQAISPGSVRATKNSEDSNKIDIVFTTGFKGLRKEWGETFYEELEVSEVACDLSRLKKGTAPFLAQHGNSIWSVIGVIEDAYIENGIGYATVRFSSREEFKGIIQDIKDGILPNVSVGYDPIEYTDVTKPGETIRTFRATKWLPLEVSSVAIGFDPDSTTKRDNQTSVEVTIINGENTMTPAEKEAADKLAKENQQKAEQQRAQELADAKKQAIKEHNEKCTKIRSQVKAAGLPSEFADALIGKEATEQQAADEIFQELEKRAKDDKKTIPATGANAMSKRELVEQALLYRADSRKYFIANKQVNHLRGASLIKIFQEVLPRKQDESDDSYAARAIVSADLANILSNVANKILDDSGAKVTATYKQITKQGSLRDFKDTPIVELSLFGLLGKTEGGEYQSATLVDTGETAKLRPRGIRFEISQEAIINDDLKAFEELPSKANFAGDSDLEDATYDILNNNPVLTADSKTLFHADHNNQNLTGVAPTVESVAAGIEAMMAQTGLGGKKLELTPKYLIVPTKYNLEAKRICAQITASKAEDVNPFGGELVPIVSSRITGDKWFLMADPNICAAIRTFTYEGMPTPKVSFDENFRSSNLELKVEYPNVAKAVNYRAVYMTVVAP